MSQELMSTRRWFNVLWDDDDGAGGGQGGDDDDDQESSAAPPSGSGDTDKNLSRAERELKKTREEAAARRTENAELKKQMADLQKKIEAAEGEKLSEQEKLAKQVQELAQAQSRLETEGREKDQRVRNAEIELAVMRAAVKLKIIDPEAAHALLMRKRDKLDDDLGNVEELLSELLEEKPYLKGEPTVEDKGKSKDSGDPPNGTGGKNGGSGGASSGPFTLKDLESGKVSQDDINKHWPWVQTLLGSRKG